LLLNIPSEEELFLNGVHPTTNTPVASRNASASDPVIAPLKSPLVIENSCGIGAVKSGGGVTIGFCCFKTGAGTSLPSEIEIVEEW